MPIKCKYSADILWASTTEGERSRKSKRIILHLRYLVTPHQMQNCVNYCRNKRAREMERGEEKQNTKLCTHIAQIQMHKTQCVIPHFLSSIISIDIASCANIDRFFGATIISTLSVSVWMHLRGWRINHRTEEKFITFSISWKLSQITFQTKLILQNVQATPTTVFLFSLFLTVSGLSWLELTLVPRT